MSLLNNLLNFNQPKELSNPFAWVKTLGRVDDVTTIDFATQQFNANAKEDFLEGGVYKDTTYQKALIDADETVFNIIERMTTHYIDIDNMSIELKERVANVVFSYHRQLYLIYLSLVDKLKDIEANNLLIILARTIYHATQTIKWRYYDYHSAPANIWSDLSRLYLIAEKLDLANSDIKVYSNQGNLTISSAFVHAWMIGSLERVSFQPKQIDLLNKMLILWGSKINIEYHFDEKKHLFYIDTKNNFPARRIRNFKPSESCRYWSLDAINLKIEMCLSLIEFNIVPKRRVIKDLISNPYILPTLEVMQSEWSRLNHKRQRRVDDRISTYKYIKISYGFENTLCQFSQQADAKTKNKSNPPLSLIIPKDKTLSPSLIEDYVDSNFIYSNLTDSQSKIVNESLNGIGLHVKKARGEVSLNMMIGILTTDESHNNNIIGLVRNIKPINKDQLQLGILVLSRRAHTIKIKNMSLESSKEISIDDATFNNSSSGAIDFSSTSFECIFLSKEESFNDCESLILHKLQFHKNHTYKIPAVSGDKLIKLTEILNSNNNWVHTRFAQTSN